MAESDNNTNNTPIEIEAVAGTPVELPDGFSVDESDIVRSGNDLILIGENGQQLVVRGYFSLANPPVIVAADGVEYSGQQIAGIAIDLPTTPTGSNPPGSPTGSQDGGTTGGDGDNGGIETTSGPDGDDGNDNPGSDEEPESKNEDLNDFETASGDDDPPEDTQPPVNNLLDPEPVHDGNLDIPPPPPPPLTFPDSTPSPIRGTEGNLDGGESGTGDDGAPDGDAPDGGAPTGVNNAPIAVSDFGLLEGGNVIAGNLLTSSGQDIDPDDDPLVLSSATFDGVTLSFSPLIDDSSVDEGGRYVSLTGKSGTLKVYENGDYSYSKNVDFTDEIESVTIGGRRTGESDWTAAGVSISAFEAGTVYLDADGRFDESAADGTVLYATSTRYGVGVGGNSNELDTNSDGAEALSFIFDADITGAVVTLNRFMDSDNGSWIAFDADGNTVGQGAVSVGEGSVASLTSTLKELTIDTGGVAFRSLFFTADDGGSFYIPQVTYQPGETESDIADQFGYTISDGEYESSATLTILDEGVLPPAAADVPTIVVESGAGETIDLNAAGVERAYGNVGDDVLDATGVSSTVYLYGGAGDDILIGGTGNDQISGGGGNDQFVYMAGYGQDSIFDFGIGDSLLFQGGDFTAADIRFEQSGDNTLVSVNSAEAPVLILHDVDAAVFDEYVTVVLDDGGLEIAAIA